MNRSPRRLPAAFCRSVAASFATTTLVLAAGCSKPAQNAPSASPSTATTPAAATSAPPPTAFPPGSAPTPPQFSAGGPAYPTAPGAQTPPSPQEPTIPQTPPNAFPPGNAVAAQAGVGAKGRSLDNEKGVLVTPAKTLFAARERVVFEIQIPQALQLFKASNGQSPASHDEFMQRVIAENAIQLPQLPAGQRYQYDPMTEQLMVIR